MPRGMAGKPSLPVRLLRAAVWSIATLGVLSVAAVLSLRWINPWFSAFMAESQVEAWLAQDPSFVLRRHWVGLGQISPNLPLAVVASEDQKFPEHWGFDVTAIEKAYALNQHSHR